MFVFRLLGYGLAGSVLAGCVSLGSLDKETPAFAGELKGNYYELAECAKAKQGRAAPLVRMDLLHDKRDRLATVTWNHELGALLAFAFQGTDADHTKLTVYSATTLDPKWIEMTKSCEQS